MNSATLTYSILCDDVRLEAGNKISLMGLFQNLFLPKFPASVMKFAVVNHWEGLMRQALHLPQKRNSQVSAHLRFFPPSLNHPAEHDCGRRFATTSRNGENGRRAPGQKETDLRRDWNAIPTRNSEKRR